MIVHVVGFTPTNGAAIGGFDWHRQLDDAKNQLRINLMKEEGHHNLALVHLEVPDGLTPEQITDYIDSNLDLIEPRGTTEMGDNERRTRLRDAGLPG